MGRGPLRLETRRALGLAQREVPPTRAPGKEPWRRGSNLHAINIKDLRRTC
jgi:hypothetical protein